MEDVVAREDGVPALSDVLLLLVLRPSDADVDINLKLRTLYHLHDTVLGSKSARLTCAQPYKEREKINSLKQHLSRVVSYILEH